jgi:ribosomal subunit interface protein
MQIEIAGRNTEVWPGTRQYIEKKLNKLRRVDESAAVEVRLSENKNTFTVDLRVVDHGQTFVASQEDQSVRAAVDAAITKLERQVDEHHRKLIAKREGAPPLSAIVQAEDEE